MKIDERDVEKILGRAVTRYGNLSQRDVDSAMELAWKNLQPDITSARGWTILSGPSRRISPLRLAFALSAAAIVLARFLMIPIFIHKVDASAMVESGDGKLLQTGQRIDAGKIVSASDAGAMLMLADGSRVEMRAGAQLLLERAEDGVRVRLNSGGVIVTAAKQRAGHLYVRTKDVTVSVVGTVFLVNAEETGSRVAVIQGEVHVQEGTSSKKLLPGEQVVSSPLMKSQPVSEEIAWSRSAEAHLALLQQSTTIEPPPLQFEVASIKPDPQPAVGVFLGTIRCQGIDGGLSSPVGVKGTVPLGRCIGRHVPLVSIIAAAYGTLEGDRGSWGDISGGPDWTNSAREVFQIEAKAENPASATMEQLRQMLQTLLADRFKLKVHRDARESAGYSLTIAKSGLKLKEFAGAQETLTVGPAEGGGGARGGPGSGRAKFVVAGKTSVSAFAAFLAACPLGRFLVVDKTELAGNYEFNLSFSLTGYHGSPCLPDFDPPLPKVLEDELGLRLEPGQKVPEIFIVIDHAEKPSEN